MFNRSIHQYDESNVREDQPQRDDRSMEQFHELMKISGEFSAVAQDYERISATYLASRMGGWIDLKADLICAEFDMLTPKQRYVIRQQVADMAEIAMSATAYTANGAASYTPDFLREIYIPAQETIATEQRVILDDLWSQINS